MKRKALPLRAGLALIMIEGFVLVSTMVAAATGAGGRLDGANTPQAHSGTGLPFIRHFSPSEYDGGPYNWAIAQDPRGVIYVGNQEGVLEFDGALWRLIQTPNRTTVRSLDVDASGRVFVGAVGELGYLAPNAVGDLEFVSLMEKLDPEDRGFTDVWNTIATEKGVYFSSFSRLFHFAGDTVHVIKSTSTIHRSFRVRQRIYVQEVDQGLMELVGDQLVSVPGGGQLRQEKISAMLPLGSEPSKNGQILICTRSNGLFRFDGKTITPFQTVLDDRLKTSLVYCGTVLADGRLALGTTKSGLFLLDQAGRPLGQITKGRGLEGEWVLSLLADREHGLWLGLNSGLARAELLSSLSHFGDHLGLEGIVVALHLTSRNPVRDN